MRAERVAGFLRLSERGAVDDERLRVGPRHLHRRLHEALDRVGDVVRLIEHIGGIESGRPARPRVDELVENEKQTERVDGAGIEVVVAVFGIVEMEAGEAAGADQPGDDLLDIDVGRMMPEIDEAERFRPKSLAAIRLDPQSAITVE